MSSHAARLGDRYEVGELIGRGGMADVHRARDRATDQDVAVKLLRDVSEVETQRFADEARLLSTLQHPNIVTLLDAGVSDDRPWIVLELVEGPTLADVMAQGPVDARRVQELGAGLASALAHAHAHGVVHRDVKPSNVLVSADGTVKLTDFGIARMADATSGLTVTGHTVGTAAYLSPEQVRGEQVTGEGDVYSLGLLLLEALTGVRAYSGPPVEAALARLQRSPLIPTSLPAGWSGLLAAMTAREAVDRPDVHEVVRCLSSNGSPALPVRQDTSTGLVSLAPPRQERRHRRRAVALAAAIAVVATLVVARGFVGDASTEAEAASATSPSRPASTGQASPVVETPAVSPTAQRRTDSDTTLPTRPARAKNTAERQRTATAGQGTKPAKASKKKATAKKAGKKAGNKAGNKKAGKKSGPGKSAAKGGKKAQAGPKSPAGKKSGPEKSKKPGAGKKPKKPAGGKKPKK